MIRFSEKRKKYTSSLILTHGERIPVILDTGAMVTTLSFKMLVNVLHCDRALLQDFINANSCITIHGVDEVQHSAAPCYLRDVQFGNIHLDRFYFMISSGIQISSIGFDFIKACTISKLSCDDFKVTYFSHDEYERTFIESALNTMPKELLVMETSFDPVTWYKQLPAEYKDKLHQYSTPLYTVLTLGQYLDEFDDILAGFRKQYGV